MLVSVVVPRHGLNSSLLCTMQTWDNYTVTLNPRLGFCVQSPEAHANCLGWAPSCHAARAGRVGGPLHPLLFSALELLAHPNSVLVQPRILPPSELTIGLHRVERFPQRDSGSSGLPAGSTDTYRHPGRGTNAPRDRADTRWGWHYLQFYFPFSCLG